MVRAWPLLRGSLAALIGGASSFLGSGVSVLVRRRFAATVGPTVRYIATAGHQLRFAVSITTRVTMSQIFEGSEVRIEVAVTTAAGQPANATSAELKLRSPSGVETTYTLGTAPYIQDAVGRYHLDLIASEPGQWDIVARGMSVLGAGANYTGKSWFLVEPA